MGKAVFEVFDQKWKFPEKIFLSIFSLSGLWAKRVTFGWSNKHRIKIHPKPYLRTIQKVTDGSAKKIISSNKILKLLDGQALDGAKQVNRFVSS